MFHQCYEHFTTANFQMSKTQLIYLLRMYSVKRQTLFKEKENNVQYILCVTCFSTNVMHRLGDRILQKHFLDQWMLVHKCINWQWKKCAFDNWKRKSTESKTANPTKADTFCYTSTNYFTKYPSLLTLSPFPLQ